jgi:hypothetical protein
MARLVAEEAGKMERQKQEQQFDLANPGVSGDRQPPILSPGYAEGLNEMLTGALTQLHGEDAVKTLAPEVLLQMQDYAARRYQQTRNAQQAVTEVLSGIKHTPDTSWFGNNSSTTFTPPSGQTPAVPNGQTPAAPAAAPQSQTPAAQPQAPAAQESVPSAVNPKTGERIFLIDGEWKTQKNGQWVTYGN